MAVRQRIRRRVRRARPQVRRTSSPSAAGARTDAKRGLSGEGGLMIGGVHDPAEKAADRMADQVMRMPASAPVLHRRCAACDGEEEKVRRAPAEPDKEEIVQTKPAPISAPVAPGAGAVAASPGAANAIRSMGSGTPMAKAERAFFEPRFGADLSAVRIHDGPAADKATRAVSARAFTLGNDIAFAGGERKAGTETGRRLMAHELAHIDQQRREPVIRRTCRSGPEEITPDTQREFEADADRALAHPAFGALDPAAQGLVRHIIDGARASACPTFYIGELLVLLNTPDAPASSTAAEMRATSASAADAEALRLSLPGVAAAATRQEALANDPARQFTTLQGAGATYQVDRTDLGNIVVRMRVHLEARGGGNAQDVARTRSLEDAIEISGSAPGYTLDIEFVNNGGPDVFTVGVDPEEWTTAGNWIGDARAMAHESQHLLRLQDRYDYIQSHAANVNMSMANRLHWFREQMVRPLDPMAGSSLMGGSGLGASMTDLDVCQVVGGDFRGCLSGRFDAISLDQLEARGRALLRPYHPRNAAMLELLRSAWERRDFVEISARCNNNDPLCGLPPEQSFGDPNVVGPDAGRFPLRNPHDQPAGSSLERRGEQSP